ncbi:MAG: MFS transporter [Bradymonadia bacterium]
MPTEPEGQSEKSSWRFSKTFWFANAMELCERAAYYGFFIGITLYLSSIVGFSDIEAGIIAGLFSGTLYLLPPFLGVLADRIGFRKSMIIAFSLLTIGYALLGYNESKILVICFLIILVFGAAFIKPLITGTVAKTTNATNRARAFSLFYWTVNIGAFSGKVIVPYIRQGMGLEYVNFFSSAVAAIALLITIFFYFPDQGESEQKSAKELARSLIGILTNARLLALTLIIAGFWTVQQQLYASMPKFVIRTVGQAAKPEWIANVNPFVVVLCVVFITQAMRKRKAINSMLVGMFIMPLSAFAMSLGPWLENLAGNAIPLAGIIFHPFTLMLVVGIGLQGLAECFISPRFLEFFSIQAPKGEEGLYLGFSHLHSFFSAILGFFISGFLLEKYCPDPATLPQGLSPEEFAKYYEHANYLWYYFVGIALLAAFALIIFKLVTEHVDKKKEQALDTK